MLLRSTVRVCKTFQTALFIISVHQLPIPRSLQVLEHTFHCLPVHASGIFHELRQLADCKGDIGSRAYRYPIQRTHSFTIWYSLHRRPLIHGSRALVPRELNVKVKWLCKGFAVIEIETTK